MERRRFTAEFKREAVRLAKQSGTSRVQVAQELGLNADMLGRWVRWRFTPVALGQSATRQRTSICPTVNG